MFEIRPREMQPRDDLIGSGFKMGKRRVLAILALEDDRLYTSVEVVRSYFTDYTLPEYTAECKALHRFACYHQIKGTSDHIFTLSGKPSYAWLGSNWKKELTPMAYAWGCKLHDSLLFQSRTNQQLGLWSRFYCNSVGKISTKTGFLAKTPDSVSQSQVSHAANANQIPCTVPNKRTFSPKTKIKYLANFLRLINIENINLTVFGIAIVLLTLGVFGSAMLTKEIWRQKTLTTSRNIPKGADFPNLSGKYSLDNIPKFKHSVSRRTIEVEFSQLWKKQYFTKKGKFTLESGPLAIQLPVMPEPISVTPELSLRRKYGFSPIISNEANFINP